MKHLIYLDYAATTPVAEHTIAKMVACLGQDGHFANPAARSYFDGQRAAAQVEQARAEVAALIHAEPHQIIWTSGATESDNLAIKGIAQSYAKRGKHIISSQIEHKAVLDSCQALARQGYEITYLAPEAHTGLIHPEAVLQAMRPDTILVSLMLVNNELGTLTDIARIGQYTRERGICLHVDAAQAAGKVAIDVNALQVDLMSLSAHKLYGPKGIGALYVASSFRDELTAQIHGGGHEQGLRSGTLATHQIVGMGQACVDACADLSAEQQRLQVLRQQLLTGLQDYADIILNGDSDQHVANYLNITFLGTAAAAQIAAIRAIAAVSSGSACNSHLSSASHVLRAMGCSPEQAQHSIRFSLGRYSTAEHIEQVIAAVAAAQPDHGIQFI
ncbi:aminotransferase class V-fold PLP-dependent enzyme [Acinetobacter larvae]|uniref:cysteine desulfurase n=1 Tax=Acinetobacter larvae TaxID=1789224 RepID=A0A1B2M0A6_9GAMM|nr:aminotransferase class V-fold PLP-dependent enzyme [Acinetobacter larvae]AOA58610.1 IscS subfamily cysteine desulfurase [Acinetobacter larvae]